MKRTAEKSTSQNVEFWDLHESIYSKPITASSAVSSQDVPSSSGKRRGAFHRREAKLLSQHGQSLIILPSFLAPLFISCSLGSSLVLCCSRHQVCSFTSRLSLLFASPSSISGVQSQLPFSRLIYSSIDSCRSGKGVSQGVPLAKAAPQIRHSTDQSLRSLPEHLSSKLNQVSNSTLLL